MVSLFCLFISCFLFYTPHMSQFVLYIFQESHPFNLAFKIDCYKLEHDSFIILKSPFSSPFSLFGGMGDSGCVPAVALCHHQVSWVRLGSREPAENCRPWVWSVLPRVVPAPPAGRGGKIAVVQAALWSSAFMQVSFISETDG